MRIKGYANCLKHRRAYYIGDQIERFKNSYELVIDALQEGADEFGLELEDVKSGNVPEDCVDALIAIFDKHNMSLYIDRMVQEKRNLRRAAAHSWRWRQKLKKLSPEQINERRRAFFWRWFYNKYDPGCGRDSLEGFTIELSHQKWQIVTGRW